jgi:pSer/pThr/pTyr-binding forkhead associated (FHA) protein
MLIGIDGISSTLPASPQVALTPMPEPDSPHSSTPSELKEQLEAEREGRSFLVYRDAGGRQVIHALEADTAQVVIGRGPTCDISLAWDPEVSRLHAVIERVGEDWAVADDGLSSNGTFLNGERVHGRKRVGDGDRVQVGETGMVFRVPAAAPLEPTARRATDEPSRISPAQRRVLVALCRPYHEGGSFAAPATNQQIADELVLGVDAIKTHMRALYDRFSVEDLPQQQKRAKLVELAFRSGEITARDFAG